MRLPTLLRRLPVLLLAAPLAAQAPAAPVAAPRRGPTDPAEVAAYLDGLMTSYLREHHIAGATVAVVRDTSVLFTRGYGWADVDKRVPADASTLFRIGSITKTFTWTAVMQLVEQGKIDLDKPIETYLDFKIPARFDPPITMRHVLTHTVGLEEDSRDLFTTDPKHVRPMKEWLPTHIPAQVRAPGTYSSYSNWAAATAGYVVERLSGMPYDEYLEKNIFTPLGMASASTRQPLPAALEPKMSKSYTFAGGRWEAKPWEIITGAWPAGSASASANDMAAFMLAHLNGGAYRGGRILSDATEARMQTRIQGHDPRIPGYAHGFYEQTTVGPRSIGHGGDTQYFHSDMMLLPSERLGVFVSFNTDKGGAVSFKPFADDFFAHYYPEPLPAIAPTRDDRAANQKYAGEYLMNRSSYTTFQKAANLAGAIKVAVGDSGVLVAETPLGEMRLVQVDSNLFRDVNTHDLVAFKTDAQGRVTHGFLSMLPMGTIEKVGTLGAPSTHLLLLGLGLVMFVGTLIAAVVRWAGARSHGGPAPDALTSRGRLLMGLASLCFVAFGIGIVIIASNMEAYIFGSNFTVLRLVLLFPMLAGLAVLGGLAVAGLQWMRGAGTTATRVRHALAVVMGLVFLWSLNTWNLLGWRL